MRRPMIVASLLLLLSACAVLAPKAPHYVVFFQEWSADLDQPALGAIAEAAQWANAHPGLTVQVRGYADPEGTPAANKGISALRAQRVSDTLTGDGVAASRIRRIAEGGVTFAQDSQESRRVEIVFAAP